MEMKKRRQKTLTGLFLKFAALFCLDTFGIGMFCLVLLVLSPMTGFTLPANYAELQLTDHTEEIKAAGTEVEALIPESLVAIIHHGNKVLLLLLKNDHFSSGFLRREYATFHM